MEDDIVKCPKCGAQTVRDFNAVFERCINCGWWREYSYNEQRELKQNEA